MTLQNKTALVTGARRGIGKSVALKLAEEGAKVAVTDISKEDCEKVVKEIKDSGGEAIAIKLDVTDEKEIKDSVQKTKKELGSLDVLVNNAGIGTAADITEMSKEEWEKTLTVNLEGVFLCTKEALKSMMDQEWGRIVNISSIAAYLFWPQLTHYSASKAGIIGLTKNVAGRVGKKNITVNAVCPGAIETKMLDDLLEELGMTRDQVIKQSPVGRIGNPEDIANLVAFLASEEASFVTGQAITADGGYSIV